jgi:hypothetical protein
MTPNIKPYLLEADRRRPELRLLNTAQSCFELLQLTLALAGPEWAFIGKTSDMDGAGVQPPGFTPLVMTLTRPDGQRQSVTLTKLGMDAAWHVPTLRQVKVIANSSANDDLDPSLHGPARLDPYEIQPQYYRWHNPPIPQFGQVADPLPSNPPPVRPPATALPKDEAFIRLLELNAFYAAPDGLQRPGGLVKIDEQGRPVADMEAIAQWYHQMVVEGVSLQNVKAQIRQSHEWRSKHPGETP